MTLKQSWSRHNRQQTQLHFYLAKDQNTGLQQKNEKLNPLKLLLKNKKKLLMNLEQMKLMQKLKYILEMQMDLQKGKGGD